MYKRFFGLRESPFEVNPNPRYLFLTRQIQEALASLTYGIKCRKGFILLTGEVGTGKTTLLNKLLDWLRLQRVATAYVFNSRLGTSDLLDLIMHEFGIPCQSREKSQVLLRLNQWLLDRYRSGESAVLIIDEAQNLSLDVLEEIRLLTNLETSTDKLLQIVLAGQPELEEKLKMVELRQLRQRITLCCRTAPLTADETFEYIAQRLHTAGANGQAIFSSEAIKAVHSYSCGIPRVVNLLCEHSMISAYVDGTRPVAASMVEEVAREFQLDEIAPAGAPRSTEDASSAGLLGHFDELVNRFRQAGAKPAQERTL